VKGCASAAKSVQFNSKVLSQGGPSLAFFQPVLLVDSGGKFPDEIQAHGRRGRNLCQAGSPKEHGQYPSFALAGALDPFFEVVEGLFVVPEEFGGELAAVFDLLLAENLTDTDVN